VEKEITLKEISKFKTEYDQSVVNKVAQNAVNRNGVANSAFNSEKARELVHKFNIDVKETGSITNQKSSGRCWMFSGLNVLRSIAMKKLKVEDLELSQSYLMFYDKLEKSNYQLEAVLENLSEENNSRLMDYIVQIGGQQDGGYWQFFVELVKKYGVCPKSAMPETIPTSASAEMDDVINVLLAKDSALLRNEHKAGKSLDELRALKEEMLNEIYRVLRICIGTPVSSFTYEYEEKSEEKKEGEEKKEEKKNNLKSITCTPKEFFDKYIGVDMDDYVVITNWPMKEYPYHQTYTARLCGNVVGAPGEKTLNLPIEDMKNAVIASLKGGELVWFACDVVASSYRKEGLLSTEVVNLDELFSVKLGFDKGDRLMYRASVANHAMTFTGVNLDENGKPNRWKVENSWGEDVGSKGYFVMSDDWFNNYMYESVINKKYLTKEQLEEYKKEPVILEPWAPVLLKKI